MIGIIGAMEIEVENLKSKLGDEYDSAWHNG